MVAEAESIVTLYVLERQVQAVGDAKEKMEFSEDANITAN